MNDFNQPPIPDPFQRLPQLPSMQRDWKSAPPIIKGWAYPLTWLSIIIMPLVMLGTFLGAGDERGETMSLSEKIVIVFFYGIFWVLSIWLNRAFKKGVRAAWTVQFVGSILGLCGFPIGTMIHGYILSQWSKPEVKAWFGMS